MSEVLGVEIPIIQSGMGGVAGPELAAAVSNAGGLGVLAALRLEPDQLRSGIGRMRELTDRPFGVNIWLHDDVRRPPDPKFISDDVVRGAQSVFNEFRPRFGLEPRLGRPPAAADLVDAALDVMVEEQIPVFCAAIGVPEAELVSRFQAYGGRVVSMVATVADAVAAATNGVDVVVAQGSESGGHRSYGQKHDRGGATGQSTLALVPAVIDAVGDRVPVLAAGGIVDGRGMAAMLALGADGVLLGSRFVATQESQASDLWKCRLTEGDRSTTLTDGFTGQWARVLASEFTEAWDASGKTALPGLLQGAAGSDVITAAKREGDDQVQPLYAGAAVGSMTGIPSAAAVVADLAAEAASVLSGSPHRELSASCFNAAWDLIDLDDRTPAQDDEMLALTMASYWHWTQRDDFAPTKASVAHWQISRVHALRGEGDMALGWGRKAVEALPDPVAEPFYAAYGFEAMARGAMVEGNRASAEEHLARAHALLPSIDDDARSYVEADLADIAALLTAS